MTHSERAALARCYAAVGLMESAISERAGYIPQVRLRAELEEHLARVKDGLRALECAVEER